MTHLNAHDPAAGHLVARNMRSGKARFDGGAAIAAVSMSAAAIAVDGPRRRSPLAERLAHARAAATAQALRDELPELSTMVVRRPGAPEIRVKARVRPGFAANDGGNGSSQGGATGTLTGPSTSPLTGTMIRAGVEKISQPADLAQSLLAASRMILERFSVGAATVFRTEARARDAISSETIAQVRRAGTAIIVAAALLLLTNASGLRSWTYDLPEGPMSAQLVAATEAWFDATTNLGLSAPKDGISSVAQALRDARFSDLDGYGAPIDQDGARETFLSDPDFD